MKDHSNSTNMGDEQAFRDALGHFATGVTIVSVVDGARAYGLTVNSFASVSLKPPLVLWCLAHSAVAFDLFAQAPHFVISVLNEDQSDLSIACARHAQHELTKDQFELMPSGAAAISHALAYFECRRHKQFEMGDHLIIIGEVITMSQTGGRPLIFHRGDYGKLK